MMEILQRVQQVDSQFEDDKSEEIGNNLNWNHQRVLKQIILNSQNS